MGATEDGACFEGLGGGPKLVGSEAHPLCDFSWQPLRVRSRARFGSLLVNTFPTSGEASARDAANTQLDATPYTVRHKVSRS